MSEAESLPPSESPPAAESDAPLKARPAPRRRPQRRRLRAILLLLGPLVVLVGGLYFYLTSGRYIATDNAYVKADIVAVSAQVDGPIDAVAVAENQRVDKGDVLFRLDDVTYRVALRRAEAELAKVHSDIEALKASFREKQAALAVARTNLDYAGREYRRQSELARKKVSSATALDDARQTVEVARQKITQLQQDAAEVLANLGGKPDIPVTQHPSYLAVKAERDQAALDLAHTIVRAPFAGVASKTPELGQYVTAGKPVMSIVADRNMWVEANFKETDLTHVRPGQTVILTVDTYPDQTFKADVQSISPASGAEFSVLPAQNASGNWVKVVQRIAVRIAIVPDPATPPLRAGMSATVEIDTGQRHALPQFVRTAFGWFGSASVAPAAPRTGNS